jgi:hypothetical protein
MRVLMKRGCQRCTASIEHRLRLVIRRRTMIAGVRRIITCLMMIDRLPGRLSYRWQWLRGSLVTRRWWISGDDGIALSTFRRWLSPAHQNVSSEVAITCPIDSNSCWSHHVDAGRCLGGYSRQPTLHDMVVGRNLKGPD